MGNGLEKYQSIKKYQVCNNISNPVSAFLQCGIVQGYAYGINAILCILNAFTNLRKRHYSTLYRIDVRLFKPCIHASLRLIRIPIMQVPPTEDLLFGAET